MGIHFSMIHGNLHNDMKGVDDELHTSSTVTIYNILIRCYVEIVLSSQKRRNEPQNNLAMGFTYDIASSGVEYRAISQNSNYKNQKLSPDQLNTYTSSKPFQYPKGADIPSSPASTLAWTQLPCLSQS